MFDSSDYLILGTFPISYFKCGNPKISSFKHFGFFILFYLFYFFTLFSLVLITYLGSI